MVTRNPSERDTLSSKARVSASLCLTVGFPPEVPGDGDFAVFARASVSPDREIAIDDLFREFGWIVRCNQCARVTRSKKPLFDKSLHLIREG